MPDTSLESVRERAEVMRDAIEKLELQHCAMLMRRCMNPSVAAVIA
jgi:hypothetical protein